MTLLQSPLRVSC